MGNMRQLWGMWGYELRLTDGLLPTFKFKLKRLRAQWWHNVIGWFVLPSLACIAPLTSLHWSIVSWLQFERSSCQTPTQRHQNVRRNNYGVLEKRNVYSRTLVGNHLAREIYVGYISKSKNTKLIDQKKFVKTHISTRFDWKESTFPWLC